MTPETFETEALRSLLIGLRSELDFSPRVPNDVADERIGEFSSELLSKAGKQAVERPILLKHALLAFYIHHFSKYFDVSVVGVMRSLTKIESTRVRRGWPPSFGSLGAIKLYSQLFSAAVQHDFPLALIRFSEVQSDPQRIENLGRHLGLEPTPDQIAAALAFLSR